MTEPTSATDLLELGISAYERNNVTDAVLFFERALDADPDLYEAMNYMGLIALNQGDEAKLIDWWTRSISTEDNAEARCHLGFYFSNMNRKKEAIAMLKRACELSAGRTDAAIQWAYLEMTEKNYEKARNILEPLLSSEMVNEQAYLMLSQVWQEEKQYENALGTLKELLAKDPNSIIALYRLAQLHRAFQNLPEAEHYYEHLIELAPDQYGVLKEYGIFLKDHISPEKSIQVFKKALELTAQDWELHGYMAQAYEKNNQLTEARDAFAKAYQLNPSVPYLKQKLEELAESSE